MQRRIPPVLSRSFAVTGSDLVSLPGSIVVSPEPPAGDEPELDSENTAEDGRVRWKEITERRDVENGNETESEREYE